MINLTYINVKEYSEEIILKDTESFIKSLGSMVEEFKEKTNGIVEAYTDKNGRREFKFLLKKGFDSLDFMKRLAACA